MDTAPLTTNAKLGHGRFILQENDPTPVLIMGFKMKDIHSPTVPSETVSSSASSHGKSTEDLTLDELMRTRTRVENELWALGSVLESVR